MIINGVTIDRIFAWDKASRSLVADIVAALKALPVRPTVRVVIDRDVSLEEYGKALFAFREAADIMLCPVDSTEMASLSMDAHAKRFSDCYRELGLLVDFWEVGNEINGSWAVTKQTNGTLRTTPYEKMADVHSMLKSQGAKTALTLWYTPAEDAAPDEEPLHWLDTHLPIRPDLVLASVYEHWYSLSWGDIASDVERFFKELERRFPNADLGIGEFGPLSDDGEDASPSVSENVRQIQRYYSFRPQVTRWIRGGFYWFFVDKCAGHTDRPVFKSLAAAMKAGA